MPIQRSGRYITLLALMATFICSQQIVLAQPLTIRTELLEVRCDSADGKLTILAAGNTKPIVPGGVLMAGGGTGTVVATSHKAFGQGQSIQITHTDGGIDHITLFPKLPFALFRSTLRNAGQQPATLNKIKTAEFPIDLGKPAPALKFLGTGGLDTPGKLVGSYMWMAMADPETRHGVVGGWITTERGSGIVFSEAAGDQVKLSAQVEFGKLLLAAGAMAESETFALGYFADARLGLEAWADTVAKVNDIKLPPQPVGYCTWYHAGSWNEKALAEQAALAGKTLKPYGFSVVQIDDGWQDGQTKNGPKKNFTQVRVPGPYAGGMKATATAISAQGLVPGIWFMPFSGSYEDPWFKDHQDWFVKKDDGAPHESRWGGTCLDMTHPGAQKYLKGIVQQIVKDWGYRYLKMDGLCSGLGVTHVYVNAAYKDDHFGDGVFSDPTQTNVEAFRNGLKLIRDAAGPETYILGCTVAQNMRAYGGGMGLVDAMRVGPDNSANWKAMLVGPTYGTRHYHLNGRIWHNDPDCIYTRPSVTLNQARALASWVTISGQLGISSEDLAKLPPERLDLLKRTMPSHGLPTRPVDLFDNALPRIWLLTDPRGQQRRDVIGLYNWDNADADFDYALDKIGLPGEGQYLAFDYWGNTLVDSFKGRLKQHLAGQSCLVLSVRALADHPQLISTSRHITQGIVDLSDEKWNAAGKELSAISQVVGADPYELRLALESTQGPWKLAGVELSEPDKAAGVTVEIKQEAKLVRVTVKSAQNRPVRWTARFQ